MALPLATLGAGIGSAVDLFGGAFGPSKEFQERDAIRTQFFELRNPWWDWAGNNSDASTRTPLQQEMVEFFETQIAGRVGTKDDLIFLQNYLARMEPRIRAEAGGGAVPPLIGGDNRLLAFGSGSMALGSVAGVPVSMLLLLAVLSLVAYKVFK